MLDGKDSDTQKWSKSYENKRNVVIKALLVVFRVSKNVLNANDGGTSLTTYPSLKVDRENNSWKTANLQHTIYLHTIYVYMLFSFSFLYGNTESVWINVWRSKSEERRGAKKRSVEVWGKGYSIFTRFRSTDDTRKKEMKNTYNI